MKYIKNIIDHYSIYSNVINLKLDYFIYYFIFYWNLFDIYIKFSYFILKIDLKNLFGRNLIVTTNIFGKKDGSRLKNAKSRQKLNEFSI